MDDAARPGPSGREPDPARDDEAAKRAQLDEWLSNEPTPEEWQESLERVRQREAERRRRLFGDRKPFPIPDVENDV